MTAVLAVAACGSDSDDSSASTGTELIKVAVHTQTPYADYSGILTAIDQGLYEKAGIEVEVQYVGSSSLAIQQVGGGTSDIGLAGSETILSSVAEGVPLKVIANHMQVTPTGVLVGADKNATSLADLKGLSVASALTSPEPSILAGELADLGLDRDKDLKMVWTEQSSKCSLYFAGDVDACTGWYTTHALQAERNNVPTTFLSFNTPERPILGNSMFATTSYLDEHGDAVKKFLQASYEGYVAAEADLDAVADLYLELNPEETDRNYVLQSLQRSHDQMHSERSAEHGWGYMEDGPWQTLLDLLRGGDMVSKDIDVATVYTDDYLPADAPWPAQ